MLLLATDTSGQHGSIALARTAPSVAEIEILEVVPLTGGAFSAQLVPQIAALLAKHGFAKDDVAAFVVASGPGSFTGLRVGLAAIKALAEVLGKPIAAVSLLEAVAVAGSLPGKVMSALDAGRGELYVGKYEGSADSLCLVSEWLLTKKEFLSQARGWSIVTPDVSVAEAARDAGLSVKRIDPPCASAIAQLGWRQIQAGRTISPEQLEANYIRRSDAEIFAKRG